MRKREDEEGGRAPSCKHHLFAQTSSFNNQLYLDEAGWEEDVGGRGGMRREEHRGCVRQEDLAARSSPCFRGTILPLLRQGPLLPVAGLSVEC